MSDNLLTKLMKAEAEMTQPKFDCVNPHFKSKYASLKAVEDSIMPSLHKHGILCVQSIEQMEYDRQRLRVWVTDGTEDITLATITICDYPNMQQFGSAITYARRYALSAAFNRVADEDDDGNATAGQAPEPKAKPEPKPRARSHDWDEIRDLITKAKRCGLTDEELSEWMNQTFEGRDKKTFGETERNIITLWLKSYIKEGKA